MRACSWRQETFRVLRIRRGDSCQMSLSAGNWRRQDWRGCNGSRCRSWPERRPVFTKRRFLARRTTEPVSRPCLAFIRQISFVSDDSQYLEANQITAQSRGQSLLDGGPGAQLELGQGQLPSLTAGLRHGEPTHARSGLDETLVGQLSIGGLNRRRTDTFSARKGANARQWLVTRHLAGEQSTSQGQSNAID